MKTFITTAATALTLIAASNAATIATPDRDADAYLFFGTNNEFDPQITLGQVDSSGHFNWGYVHFDTTTLSSSGDKHLKLSAIEYKILTPSAGGPPTTTTSTSGSATVQLVALGVNSYDDYLASPDRQAWYDANVQNAGVPILGTFNFVNESTLSIDVTSTVNAWIADDSTNNGFALFSTSGNVELASATYSNSSLVPSLADAAAAPIPEPSAAILSALGLLTLTLRRRR